MTKLVEYQGHRHTINELADMAGVHYDTMRKRLLRMPVEAAMIFITYRTPLAKALRKGRLWVGWCERHCGRTVYWPHLLCDHCQAPVRLRLVA